MKLEQVEREIRRFGDFDEEFFDIGDKSVMLTIMRDKMYSDPILAIVRELTANARDSHRERGCPEIPIEVHLPSEWDQHFHVKDFGVGISPYRMSEIFIKYGNSTKRVDDLQTGGFGLGAKTPFSYTDAFTVTSTTPLIVASGIKVTREKCVHDPDGDIYDDSVLIRRNYSAYIDETNVGKMALISEQKVTEGRGVTISFPVGDMDYHKFLEALRKACQHWDVKPNVTGLMNNENIHWPEITDVIMEGEDYTICKRQYGYGTKSMVALHDDYPYPVDTQFIVSAMRDNEDSSFEKFISHVTLYMNFGISDLSLTATRESLDYGDGENSKTLKSILSRLQKIKKDLSDFYLEKIKDSDNYWDANVKYKKAKGQTYGYIDEAFWNGIPVIGKPINFGQTAVTVYKYRLENDKMTRREKVTVIPLISTCEVGVCLCDVPESSMSSTEIRQRIYTLMVENNYGEVYLVRFPHTEEAKKIASDYLNKNYNWNHFDFPKISELELTAYLTYKSRGTRGGSSGQIRKILKYHPIKYNGDVNTQASWKDVSVDLEDIQGYYVEIKRRKPYFKGKEICLTQFNQFFKYYAEHCNEIPDVYGIPTRFLKTVLKNANLKPLSELLIEGLSFINTKIVGNNFNQDGSDEEFVYDADRLRTNLPSETLVLIGKDHVINRFIELGKKYKDEFMVLMVWKELIYQIAGLTKNKQEKKESDFANAAKTITKRYPLLAFFSFNCRGYYRTSGFCKFYAGRDKDGEFFAEYVKLMDEKYETENNLVLTA